ncbi:hypothetical protein [Nocardia sp. NPDC057353]|uniref:hypothetical protein n=1 Tax=Nocardia sp. NPDC057353 TaxID=3346104 RepID=UPI00362F3857
MRTLAYAAATVALAVGMSATTAAAAATAAPADPAVAIQWETIPSGSAVQDLALLNTLVGALVCFLGGGVPGSAGGGPLLCSGA